MFTDVGFHLKSGFKKILCSQMLVFTLILVSRKFCVHQFFLYLRKREKIKYIYIYIFPKFITCMPWVHLIGCLDVKVPNSRFTQLKIIHSKDLERLYNRLAGWSVGCVLFVRVLQKILAVKEGWPIRGLELIMWPERPWTDKQIYTYINWHRDSLKELA